MSSYTKTTKMNYRKGKAKGKGKVNKAVKSYVNKVLDERIEDKQAGGLVGATAISSGSTYVVLNTIAQGVNQGQRIGMAVKSKYLYMRIFLHQAVGFEGLSERLRLMLLWDKQPNGAVPTSSNLLTNITAGQLVNSPVNINGSKRYRVIYDKIITLKPYNNIANNVRDERTIIIRKKLRTMTKYLGTGATSADIQSNSLCLFFTGANNNECTITFQYDYRYEDA